MKKVILILSVMLLSIFAAFAAEEMTVTWEWLLDDPDVTYHRYQLNGMEEDGWTVVAGDVNEYVATGLDPYLDHTLYLERSYDGVNWSEAASAVATALLVEETPMVEEVPVVEEVAVIEETVVVEEPVVAEEVAEEASPVEETAPVAVEPVVAPIAPETPAAPKGELEFSLLVRPYYQAVLNYDSSNVLSKNGFGLGLSLDFDNVVAFTENSGFGLRFDVGSTQYSVEPFRQMLIPSGVPAWQFWSWNWGALFDLVNEYHNDLNMTLFATVDARAGIADFSFGLGGGASFLFTKSNTYIPEFYEYSITDSIKLAAYAAANLGIKFYIGDVFSVGIDGVYKVYFPDYKVNSVDASVVLGFTF